MKALTLRHPWAFCIAHWGKRIENRSWSSSLVLGKRIAIHGGRPPGKADSYRLNAARQFSDLFDRLGHPPGFHEETTYRELLALSWTPGIVATAVVDRFVTQSDDPWFDGPIGWVLRDVIVLPEPIACKGKQGLWTVPDEIVKQLEGSEDDQ